MVAFVCTMLVVLVGWLSAVEVVVVVVKVLAVVVVVLVL